MPKVFVGIENICGFINNDFSPILDLDLIVTSHNKREIFGPDGYEPMFLVRSEHRNGIRFNGNWILAKQEFIERRLFDKWKRIKCFLRILEENRKIKWGCRNYNTEIEYYRTHGYNVFHGQWLPPVESPPKGFSIDSWLRMLPLEREYLTRTTVGDQNVSTFVESIMKA